MPTSSFDAYLVQEFLNLFDLQFPFLILDLETIEGHVTLRDPVSFFHMRDAESFASHRGIRSDVSVRN